jgi:hypothetical protein
MRLMARQSLVWTALPAGLTADQTGLRVSVHLAPRLDPEVSPPLLASFAPDWTDWPKTLAAATFRVRYGARSATIANGTIAGPDRVDVTLGAPDSAVWTALFKPDLPVEGFRFEDLSQARISSFDAGMIATIVEQLYGTMAASANDELPTVAGLLGDESWRALVDAVRRLDAATVDRSTGLRDPERQARVAQDFLDRTAGLLKELVRFQHFHTPDAPAAPRDETRRDDPRIRARWQEPRRADLPRKNELAKTLDFHRIVAAMGSYPVLMRRLGLVVDLVIDPGSFDPSPDAPLSVAVDFPAGHLAVARTNDASPRVRTQLGPARFQPVNDAADDSRIVDGLLDLDVSRYRLMQIDVDGAGLKLLNLARTLGRRTSPLSQVDPVSRQPDRIGAPALRGGGLALVERARSDALAKRLGGNVGRNAALLASFAGAGPGPDLHWQDILRGWRIDIWDAATGKWQSLCRRHARYLLAGGTLVVSPPGEEEATVRMAATLPADRAAMPDTLRLHETAVAWTGWSLAAPPPGRAIDTADRITTSTTQSAAEVPPGIDFSSEFRAVPGSLPRLRYGRSYWIRARAVDLAGHSLAPQTVDFGPEQSVARAQRYMRFDPVLPPVRALISRGGAVVAPREGEAMDRLVIRSFNDTPGDNAIPTSDTAYRAALPPRVSVRDAELHGMLDVEGRVDQAAFNQLAFAKDVDPANPLAVVREVEVAVPTPFAAQPTRQAYAVHEVGRGLTYLPDPLARRAAARLFDHPGIDPSEVIDIPLYPDGEWPEARPFLVSLYDASGERPHFDAATRTLRIPLPKGVRARLHLSMKLDAPSLALMGVFGWMTEAQRAAQTPRALSGGHWMLTPWQTVELVHAVQRPLASPEIASMVIQRNLGDTAAKPVMIANVSIKSTDRLDLLAEWHEPAAGSAGEPLDRSGSDAAFHVKVTAAMDYASRMTAPEAGGYPDHTVVAEDVIGINVTAHQVCNLKVHEFNDTRYRRILYRLEATTRFREQLPHELITREQDGVRVSDDERIKTGGNGFKAWVPNAAPPPMPQLLYVVPTFGWTRRRDADGLHSVHRAGGGLRVYLDGPWNVSGYGEMLAVVLPRADFAGDPDQAPRGKAYKTYVTQWGSDPAWDSAAVRGLAPRRADFARMRGEANPSGQWLPPGAPASEADQPPGGFPLTGLIPPGISGVDGAVEIAPHDVFWDPERSLWYADIEIAPGGAYFPFIRLALARYQPVSVNGAHLSSVVLADFAVLPPDRWLNAMPVADGRICRVSVFGVGYDDSAGHVESARAPSMSVVRPFGGGVENLSPAAVSPRSVIELWVEHLDERLGDDFGWRRVSSAVTRHDPQPQPSSVPLERAVGEVSMVSQARARVRALLAGGEPLAIARPEFTNDIRIWQTLWDGDIEIPALDGRMRLVVAEYEEYLADDDAPYDKVPTRKGRRLVFVEHIPVDW